MSFISNWYRPLLAVPKHVHFVAVVFAVATIFVVQEVGMALAQNPMPSTNFDPAPVMDPGQMGPGPMPGTGSGENFVPQQPQTQSGQQPFQPQQIQQPYQQQQPNQGFYQQKFTNPVGESNPQPSPDPVSESNPQPSPAPYNCNSADCAQKQQQMGGQDEARQKQDMQRGLNDMKRGVKQMLSPLKKMSTRIATLEKQGVGIPAEIKAAVEKALQDVQTVLNATSFEDEAVQTAMESLPEIGPSLGEYSSKIEQLAQMPKVLKQAAKEIKKLETAFARTKKTAARSRIDVSALMSQYEQAVTDIKNGYANATQLASSGDAEGAMDALQEEVFNKLGDAYQYEGTVKALQNVRSQMTQLERFMKNAKSKITKAQKSGQDVTEAGVMLEDMAAKLTELKQMLGGAVDPEALRDLVADIFDLQQNVSDALEMNTYGVQMPQMPVQQQPSNQFNFQLPNINFGNSGGEAAAPSGQ